MQKRTTRLSLLDLPAEQSDSSPQTLIRLTRAISLGEYGRVEAKLEQLFYDVTALYAGEWPEYESCSLGYHNLHHCLAVALASARMTAGWNKTHSASTLSEKTFLAGIAAALFHDSGYLKDKHDHEGKGGKYTFSHVGRSKDLARIYLNKNGWSGDDIILACDIIELTEFGDEPDLTVFGDPEKQTMAKIVASADLMAQMADINYIRNLHDLYDEFVEAYESEGRQNLIDRSIHVYDSFQEMLDNTPDFYEKFVLPRLESFGWMDKYMVAFFADGRNPYHENITANLSGQLLTNRAKWQKLGDILQKLELVDPVALENALNRQQERIHSSEKEEHGDEICNVSQQLFNWLQSEAVSGIRTRLGDILMEMEAVDQSTLRTGLISQLLPGELTGQLSREELLGLLQVSLLLQNLYEDPWLLSQVMEMTRDILQCRAGSLLLIDQDETDLFTAIHIGSDKNDLLRKKILLGKGLSGWVFRHGRTAFVTRSAKENDKGRGKHFAEEIGTSSVIAVPLHIHGEVIGVMEFIDKVEGEFTDHDADLLTLLANFMDSSLSLVSTLLKTDKEKLH